jgi:beta-glucanase (GH16 family)
MNRSAGYRNNEEQSYKSSQVEVKDGQLVITAQRNQAGVWTSGEVNSKWMYTYGDFEVRTRLSTYGPGVWPAAWLFNSAGVWPGGGEIDIYESLNTDLAAFGTIHAGGTSGHWQKQEGVYNIDPRSYHVYKISKQPGIISWWVDGVKRAEWRKDSLLSGQTWPFDDYAYIGLLNLAIGGNWPGPSTASTPSEIKYYIDYFTVKNAR